MGLLIRHTPFMFFFVEELCGFWYLFNIHLRASLDVTVHSEHLDQFSYAHHPLKYHGRRHFV